MNDRKTLLVLCLILSLSAAALGQTSSSPKKLDAAAWRSDLKHMAEQIVAVHKDPFNKITRDEFSAAVAELDAKIPSLDDNEIVVGMMRLVAMIGDGHTGLRWGTIATDGVLPVRFYQFEDGIYIRNAGKPHEELVGAKLLAVNGVPVNAALKRIEPIIWRDNPMGVRSTAPAYLSVPPILQALGLASARDLASFTLLKNGRERTVELSPAAPLANLWNPPAGWATAQRHDVTTPLWLRSNRENFWFEYLSASKTFYIQFNAVQNTPDETAEAFFQRAFAAAERSEAERLVLDMRNNGGGNNYLNRPLTIGAIKSRFNQRGKFFVIIGRETFSAAQNAVNDLEKYTNAIFVGEPTGASPNHFGDARPITLPNSGIRLQASTLWWQDKDPRDDRIWKAPDIAADLKFEYFQDGRDPAMEAILEYKGGPTLQDIVNEARATGDLDRFIIRFNEFRKDPRNKYADTMGTLNRVGHFLLNNDRADDAMKVFLLNAEHHPSEAIVYQSLGDIYAFKGDKQKALESYKMAVSLDPKLTASVGAIKALSEK